MSAKTVEDIALTLIPGIGVKGVVHLLEVFGSAERVFAASEEELAGRAALRRDLAQRIVRREGFAAAEREAAHCVRHGLCAVASTDGAYPSLLRETPDYPHIIYVKGDPAVLAGPCVSVVGTRDASAYGQKMCARIVHELIERVPGVCIVSGLAFGIDVRRLRPEARPRPCCPARCRTSCRHSTRPLRARSSNGAVRWSRSFTRR